MKLKLVEKRDEAKGTKSFFWEPEKPVSYLPGQYYYYTIDPLKFPDSRGTTRHFTISSSPTEGNNLRLTTRIRQESGYKQSLDALPIGAEIEGEGPNGTFILDEKDIGPQVFIAGGIGITPFRSILKYIADKGLLIPVYLIYSNSIPEEAAFIKELTEWEKAHSNIKIAMTMSHMEESKEKWSGSTGRVDDVMLKKFLADWKLEAKNCMFWVCGPPPMIDAMEQVLGKMAIGSDKIRSEKFTGY